MRKLDNLTQPWSNRRIRFYVNGSFEQSFYVAISFLRFCMQSNVVIRHIDDVNVNIISLSVCVGMRQHNESQPKPAIIWSGFRLCEDCQRH